LVISVCHSSEKEALALPSVCATEGTAGIVEVEGMDGIAARGVDGATVDE
jgi:hypothetical protein